MVGIAQAARLTVPQTLVDGATGPGGCRLTRPAHLAARLHRVALFLRSHGLRRRRTRLRGRQRHLHDGVASGSSALEPRVTARRLSTDLSDKEFSEGEAVLGKGAHNRALLTAYSQQHE